MIISNPTEYYKTQKIVIGFIIKYFNNYLFNQTKLEEIKESFFVDNELREIYKFIKNRAEKHEIIDVNYINDLNINNKDLLKECVNIANNVSNIRPFINNMKVNYNNIVAQRNVSKGIPFNVWSKELLQTDDPNELDNAYKEAMEAVNNLNNNEKKFETGFSNFDDSPAIGFYRKTLNLLAGNIGSGKAQPLDTIIPTPSGNKRFGDLKVGDYVFDRRGKPTKVIGVYPRGKLDLFKVTLKDGRETYCNDDHLWNYYDKNDNIHTVTLKSMIKTGLKCNNSNLFKYKIPMNCKVTYEKYKKLPIHPYVIGVFLGNGCNLEKYLTVSTGDKFIVKKCAEELKFKFKKVSKNNYSWQFFDNKRVKTLDVFKGFEKEMCVKSFDKRIPEIYKYSSVSNRCQLLQGLFDTDGSVTNNKKLTITYSTTSLGLAKDIQEVLLSLGYSSTIRLDRREGKRDCYEIVLLIPNSEKHNLFSVPRKLNRIKKFSDYVKRRDYGKIAITKITNMHKKVEMMCIKVDNEEELYLTNDFIVTHNTSLSVKMSINFAKKGYKVLFFSQEMSKNELMNKILGNINKININKFFTNNLSEEYVNKIKNSSEELSFLSNIYIDYKSPVTQDYVNMMIKQYKPDIVFIDHLHIMKNSGRAENRNQELGIITADLKAISKQHNCCIFLLSQLSRKDKKQLKKLDDYIPQLEDIRESGNIEANCDVIAFIFRPEYFLEKMIQGVTDEKELATLQEQLLKNVSRFQLLIKKNRNGQCKAFNFRFFPALNEFEEYDEFSQDS